ncbi:MAG: FAD-dependent oxidoreductase [Planctomycetota bacterium]
MNTNASEPAIHATRDDGKAFPRLTDDQVARAARFGEVETLPSGTVIFQRGETKVDFFIVLRGRVEIYDDGVCDEDGTPTVIHVHREHGFTGELDLFSGRKILVSGRLATDDGQPGQVLRVPRQVFARLMSAEPDVGDVVLRAFILRRLGLIDNAQGGVLLIGLRGAGETLRLERFLRRNGYPLRVLHIDDADTKAEANEVLAERDMTDAALPVLVCSETHTLSRPSIAQVGECLGLTESPEPGLTYDVAVVGAGPAGLAASVYAASEGLRTLVIEGEAPGGQAGTSSRIENYLGFPTGVSGWELAARAEHQAQKFGATLLVPRRAERLERSDAGGYLLHLDRGAPVRARTIVIACGARWRTLDLQDYEKFENNGIHYAATAIEADACRDKKVVVIGGGNSAGQAAVFLSGRASCVHMLVRREGLAASMSDYLVQRIEASDKINLLCNTRVTGLEGDDRLERITWQTGDDTPTTHDIQHLFPMIGAMPNSDWLDGVIERDDRGFIKTGSAITSPTGNRPPHALETSLPGVFAVGDIRDASVKRVASAVGEGSVCIQDVHNVLAEQATHR